MPGYLNGGRLVCKAASMESLCNVFDYPTLPFSKGPSQDEQSLDVPSPKNSSGFPALLMLGVGEKKVMLQNGDCKEKRWPMHVVKPTSCQPWMSTLEDGCCSVVLQCSCPFRSQAASPRHSPSRELSWATLLETVTMGTWPVPWQSETLPEFP